MQTTSQRLYDHFNDLAELFRLLRLENLIQGGSIEEPSSTDSISAQIASHAHEQDKGFTWITEQCLDRGEYVFVEPEKQLACTTFKDCSSLALLEYGDYWVIPDLSHASLVAFEEWLIARGVSLRDNG